MILSFYYILRRHSIKNWITFQKNNFQVKAEEIEIPTI